jgi:hypothetical protein
MAFTEGDENPAIRRRGGAKTGTMRTFQAAPGISGKAKTVAVFNPDSEVAGAAPSNLTKISQIESFTEQG